MNLKWPVCCIDGNIKSILPRTFFWLSREMQKKIKQKTNLYLNPLKRYSMWLFTDDWFLTMLRKKLMGTNKITNQNMLVSCHIKHNLAFENRVAWIIYLQSLPLWLTVQQYCLLFLILCKKRLSCHSQWDVL